MRMRRGLIAVGGRVRDFAGLQMKGGTMVLMGGAEVRTGAWMVRGTIVSLTPLRLLPTFSYACEYNPVFLRLYAKHLQQFGLHIPVDAGEGCYQRYTGGTPPSREFHLDRFNTSYRVPLPGARNRSLRPVRTIDDRLR